MKWTAGKEERRSQKVGSRSFGRAIGLELAGMAVLVLSIVLSDSHFYWQVLLLLVTVQLLIRVRHKLRKVDDYRQEAMEGVKSTIELVEAVLHSESGSAAKVFAAYTLKLTGLKMAFLRDCRNAGGSDTLVVKGVRDQTAEAALGDAIEVDMQKLRKQDSVSVLNVPGAGEYMLVPVKSATRFMGVLGVRIEPAHGAEDRQRFSQQLDSLSQLCAVMLEKHQMEQIQHQVMIAQEQNRIADEMHDNVSQHLFGIVYAIHSLNRKWQHISEAQLKEQLQLIQESSSIATQELRSTIYGLSSRKNDGVSWIGTVQNLLDNLSKLNELIIHFHVSGDAGQLPVPYRKALYRMISEAVGNAIRHGFSSFIEVELELAADSARLIVKDNGVGFNVKEHAADGHHAGLGMGNMMLLTQSLGGTMDISSNLGKGTQIVVSMPVVNRDGGASHKVRTTG